MHMLQYRRHGPLLSEQSAYVENDKQQDADKLRFSWSFVGTSDFWGY